MQKTIEHVRANKSVPPACIELLIRERSKGKTLRQLGRMFGKSHEKIRQLLVKYGPPQVALLPENRAAAKLGYPWQWLARLRKEGVINPVRPGGCWLYSEEQMREMVRKVRIFSVLEDSDLFTHL